MTYDSYATRSGNESVMRAYEEFPLLMPRWGYVASAFVLFLIGFFGFFLNLLVILLMFKDKQLWTPLNMILFNLVCSDFSVSVLGNPFTLTSALFHRWVFGHEMCVLYGFFMALLGITSITTLTVLSFERYLMVSRPFSSRHLSSRGACLAIVFIWTYSLALTTPPLFGWGNYVSEAANISCSVNWQEQTFNTLTYILFLFAMGQVVPCAVISFSYYKIIRTMKDNNQRMGRVSRAEAKVTAMVLVMILAFMVAWTPYSVLALLEQFANQGMVSPGVGVIPALIAKSSICYDPLIYVGMNTQFRSAIKRLFGIHSKDGMSTAERGYDNTMVSPDPKISHYHDTNARLSVSVTATSKIHTQIHKNDRKITIIGGPLEKIKYQRESCAHDKEDMFTCNRKRSSSENVHSVESLLVDGIYQEDNNKLIPKIVINENRKDDVKSNGNDFVDSYDNANIYRNQAFDHIDTDLTKDEEEDHNVSEDVERTYTRSKIKHSSSLEIKRVRLEPKVRKMSGQANFELSNKRSRNRSITSSMISSLIDRNYQDRYDNFKKFLFTNVKNDNEGDSL